jgi:5-methylcytosine-specific restriction endonuclease McrA
LEIHHITPRPYGSDHPKNLMTLCKECHKGVHEKLTKYLKDKGIDFRT